tara:strand:+ start:4817 stop:4996 length:180 start_codon:yes stop_codon:yes gene_type:complete
MKAFISFDLIYIYRIAVREFPYVKGSDVRKNAAVNPAPLTAMPDHVAGRDALAIACSSV